MNILITGGAGFIGSHLVEKFIENQYKVIVIDNLLTGSKKNIKHRKDVLLKHFNDLENSAVLINQIFNK